MGVCVIALVWRVLCLLYMFGVVLVSFCFGLRCCVCLCACFWFEFASVSVVFVFFFFCSA